MNAKECAFRILYKTINWQYDMGSAEKRKRGVIVISD